MADRAIAAARPRRPRKLAWLQPAVLSGSLIPFVGIGHRALRGQLGANPIETAMNQLGLLALLFLFASLGCTPLKMVFGWKWPLRLRKTLGLLAFFTALLHFLVYLVLDQGLRLAALLEDVIERPFIALGLLGLLTMLPLALTSTKKALQRMGPKRWKRLHRLAYLAGVLGAIHYLLRVKTELREPAIYASVLAALLLTRVAFWLRDRRRRRA
jgi:sulfoxide reductase heme-binding subunit YedZ